MYLTECPEARQDKKVQNILNRVHPIIRRNMQRDATKKQTWWKGQGSMDWPNLKFLAKLSPIEGKNMTDVEIIEVTGHVLFTLNNFKRARDLMAPGISSKRSNEVQGILDMIEYRNEIVIWLTEQRNYRGGWISTQVRISQRLVFSIGDTTRSPTSR